MYKVNSAGEATKARGASKAVPKAGRAGFSSGAMASAKNNRITRAVMNHPKRTAAVGGALLGGYALSKIRRSGLDKSRGRPTGMYNY